MCFGGNGLGVMAPYEDRNRMVMVPEGYVRQLEYELAELRARNAAHAAVKQDVDIDGDSDTPRL